jgi:1-acyl-sn-glycerol-3-phosphate acyltransferase
MPSFRRQTTTESPLKDRVRDAAVEAARESQQRIVDAAREVAEQAPERAQQLRVAVERLDVRWARSVPAQWVRERFMQLVMNPIRDHYAARRATGFEALQQLKGPVILVANHASHMDTPIILSALPRRLRKRTAVAAAADYFYRYRITAWLASLLFNTVPVDRKGGSGGTKGTSHLDKLLDDGWNLLLYPEGSRKHADGPARVKRGAAVLASHHNLSIVPIRVTGTAAAMPPGAFWPKRLQGRLFTRRHRVDVTFGEPIPPLADTAALIERVQNFFESGESGSPSISPYRRRITGGGGSSAGDDDE